MLLGALLLACGDPGPRTYSVRGVVRDVHPEYQQIVVEHEDVPGLMPAMTMNFDVADPALLEDLAPGQPIEFELQFTGKSYRILALEAGEGRAGHAGGLVLGDALGAADRAPGFRLTDQDGAPLDLSDLRGRPLLLDFIYTRCAGPCPILTGLHVEAQRALGPAERRRSHFVSITLDPAHDTPEVLAAYARARGADLDHWSFLTGPVAEVEGIVKRYGVGTVRQPDGQIDHLVVSFLIDPEGRITRRYLGLETDPQTIARDLSRLLAAAGPAAAAHPGPP